MLSIAFCILLLEASTLITDLVAFTINHIAIAQCVLSFLYYCYCQPASIPIFGRATKRPYVATGADAQRKGLDSEVHS